jgi:hypothetical protein
MKKTRIWNRTEVWPGKVNFVDSNDVILGYDLEQNCCEHAFWTISKNPDGSDRIFEGGEGPDIIEIEGYAFDPGFCELQDCSDEYECGTVAIFKLVDSEYEQKPPLYIRLENHHNGYYSHGFTFRGDTTTRGDL